MKGKGRILPLFFVLLLTSCTRVGTGTSSVVGEDYHTLHVVDSFGILGNDVAGQYEAGEKIEVQVSFRSGPRAGLIFDGKDYSDLWTESTTDGDTYEVVMPDHDCYLFTSLDGSIESLDGTLPEEIQRMNLEVEADYGRYSQDHAVLLLSGILPFFDPEDCQVDSFLPGDQVKLYFTGDIYIQETYPAKAILDEAMICALILQENACQLVDKEEFLLSWDEGRRPLCNKVILDEEGTFTDIEDYLMTDGELFASISPEEWDPFNADAYYAYMPRG